MVDSEALAPDLLDMLKEHDSTREIEPWRFSRLVMPGLAKMIDKEIYRKRCQNL